jgi:hypothetical protein
MHWEKKYKWTYWRRREGAEIWWCCSSVVTTTLHADWLRSWNGALKQSVNSCMYNVPGTFYKMLDFLTMLLFLLNQVKVKFTLEQATKAQRGSRVIALLLLSPQEKVGVGGQCHATAATPPGKTQFPCIGGWVDPRGSLDGCGKSRTHWYSIPEPSSP